MTLHQPLLDGEGDAAVHTTKAHPAQGLQEMFKTSDYNLLPQDWIPLKLPTRSGYMILPGLAPGTGALDTTMIKREQ